MYLVKRILQVQKCSMTVARAFQMNLCLLTQNNGRFLCSMACCGFSRSKCDAVREMILGHQALLFLYLFCTSWGGIVTHEKYNLVLTFVCWSRHHGCEIKQLTLSSHSWLGNDNSFLMRTNKSANVSRKKNLGKKM